MAWWTALIGPVVNMFTKGLDIIDDLVPDKDLAAKLKAALEQRIANIAHTEFISLLEARKEIILAEAKGGWLQRNWRPGIMAMFGAIIGNNYIIAPYIGLFFGPEYKMMLEIPPDMWGLLKLGISGYIVGRSIEKVAAGDGLKSVGRKLLNGMQ